MYLTYIPVCPVDSLLHTVKQGESLVSVARQYRINPKELYAANPDLKPGSTPADGVRIRVPQPWKQYKNRTYKVLLRHPQVWRKMTDDRYQGPGGYFQVSAIASPGTIYDVCFTEAYHMLKPYGSRPILVRTQIQGQSACFIFPSPDQSEAMHIQAALLAAYPEPVVMAGQSYHYFALWAHRDYIQALASTLEFIR